MLMSLGLAIMLSAGASAQSVTPKPAAAPARGEAVRTIDIVATDDMKFDVTQIAARPGERLRIRLKSQGTMPKLAMAHNVVVLRLGVDEKAFNAAALTARATDFVPPSRTGDVLASTTLAGAGERVEVTFTVPSKTGSYPFICSFPGHFNAGMRGTLVVK